MATDKPSTPPPSYITPPYFKGKNGAIIPFDVVSMVKYDSEKYLQIWCKGDPNPAKFGVIESRPIAQQIQDNETWLQRHIA